MQVQQTNIPYAMHASVSASCKDARTSQHNLVYIGLLQAQPLKLPFEMFMSVFIRLKDAHARSKRYFGLLHLDQPKVPREMYVKCLILGHKIKP